MAKRKPIPIRRIVEFVQEHHEEYGYPPTYEEIAADLGISTSCAYRMVAWLAKNGLLECTKGKARSITVTEKGKDET